MTSSIRFDYRLWFGHDVPTLENRLKQDLIVKQTCPPRNHPRSQGKGQRNKMINTEVSWERLTYVHMKTNNVLREAQRLMPGYSFQTSTGKKQINRMMHRAKWVMQMYPIHWWIGFKNNETNNKRKRFTLKTFKINICWQWSERWHKEDHCVALYHKIMQHWCPFTIGTDCQTTKSLEQNVLKKYEQNYAILISLFNRK